jgi:O-antigen ligase
MKVFKILAWISIIGALTIMTSVPAYLILWGTLSGMMIYARKPSIAISILVIFAVVLVTPLGVQTKDFKTLPEYCYEPNSLDEYHLRVRKSSEMTYTPRIGVIQHGGYMLILSSSLVTAKTIPEDYVQVMTTGRSKDGLFGSGQLSQRILEWQAALNIIGEKPLLGVGIGNYQSEIGHYYHSFPKLNTMEPNTQNGYLIITSTMGFFGLGALFWLLLYFWRILKAMLKTRDDKILSGLSIGLVGSFAAFTLYNFFCPLVNQSLVVLFLVVLAFVEILKEIVSGASSA